MLRPMATNKLNLKNIESYSGLYKFMEVEEVLKNALQSQSDIKQSAYIVHIYISRNDNMAAYDWLKAHNKVKMNLKVR